jgi:hypothetical protein
MSTTVGVSAWPYKVATAKDPNATLDYQLDWSSWLATGESISTVTVTVTGATLVSNSNTATTVTAWISGGTVGEQVRIQYRITTNNSQPRIDDRTLILRVADR